MKATRVLLSLLAILWGSSVLAQDAQSERESAAQVAPTAYCETTASGEPVQVYASFFINSFRDFDTVTETYVVDFFFNMRWEDPAYRNAPTGPLLEMPCFHPQPTIINGEVEQEQSSDQPFEIIYSNDEYGIVQWLSRYQVALNTNLNLRDFPNDSHALPVIIEDFIMDETRMEFLYEKARSPEDGPLTSLQAIERVGSAEDVINHEYLGLQEWEISEVQVAIERNPYSFFDNALFSQFRFTLFVERDPAYYNFNVIFIMLLIVSMSFAVFFIAPNALIARLELSVAIFLSLVAHNYVVQTTLPHIPYLTTLDIQMMGAKVIVFLTFCESVVVYLLSTASTKSAGGPEYDQLPVKIDRAMNYLFPVIIAAILFIG